MYFPFYLLLFITKSCQERRDSRREAKIQNKRKERKFPLYALTSQAWPQTNLHPQGLHITVATHNCSISSKSRVHPQGYVRRNPRHSFLAHLSCLPNIQTFFQTRIYGINPSSAVDPLSDYPHTHIPIYTL